jgi:hypothetical protein
VFPWTCYRENRKRDIFLASVTTGQKTSHFGTHLQKRTRHTQKAFNSKLLSALIFLASDRRSSDFGSTRYGLVYATGRQSKNLPVKKHSAGWCSLHCYMYTLLVLWVQQRNVIFDDSTEQGMHRACHTDLPSYRPPFCKTPRQMKRTIPETALKCTHSGFSLWVAKLKKLVTMCYTV